MIRLVLTDMDGTLLPAGWNQVSPLAMQAIRELDELGILFGPASGRDIDDVASFFGFDMENVGVALLSNGQKIRIGGELVRTVPYDRSALERLRVLCQETPGLVLSFPVEGQATLVMGSASGRVGEFPENWFPVSTRAVDELPDFEIAKAGVAFFGDEGRCSELMELFAEKVPEIRFVSPITGWFDLIEPSCSKAEGIEWLCRRFGIGLDEVCVFGDSDNDLEMIELVPCSVVVADASPCAAAAARWHIGAAADDSVAHALLEIAAAAREGRMPSFA